MKFKNRFVCAIGIVAICIAVLSVNRVLCYTGCAGDGTNTSVITEFVFHEGSGSTAFNTGLNGDSGNATLINGASFSTNLPPISTNCGYSISFPSTGSGSTTPALETSATYDPLSGASKFVLMVWVKRESAGSTSNTSARILSDINSLGSTASGAEFKFQGSTGLLTLNINGTERNTTVGGIAPNEGNWHHVAVVYDGTRSASNALSRNVHFYVDGIQRGDGNTLTNIIVGTNTNRLTIGNSAISRGTGNLLVGKMDDVRVLAAFAPGAVGDGKTNDAIRCYMLNNPSAQPAAILCASPVTVTNSSSQCTVTGIDLGHPFTSDLCGSTTITSNAPTAFPVGVTLVTWKVFDTAGHTNTCRQRVTVVESSVSDSDGDGISDCWEMTHNLNALDPQDADADPDGDGLSNYAEYVAKTDPHIADTDGDGVSDGQELANGTDPLSGDMAGASSTVPCPPPQQFSITTDPEESTVVRIADVGPVNDGFTVSGAGSLIATNGRAQFYKLPPQVGPAVITVTSICTNTTTFPGADIRVKSGPLDLQAPSLPNYLEATPGGAIPAHILTPIALWPGLKAGQDQKVTISWSPANRIRIYLNAQKVGGVISNPRTFTSKDATKPLWIDGLENGEVIISAQSYGATDTVKLNIGESPQCVAFGDANGSDLIISNSTTMWGQHAGLRTFRVLPGATVSVLPLSGGTGGWLRVEAKEIDVQGTIDSSGTGYPGGNGASAGIWDGGALVISADGQRGAGAFGALGGGAGLNNIQTASQGGDGANGTSAQYLGGLANDSSTNRTVEIGCGGGGSGGGGLGSRALSELMVGSTPIYQWQGTPGAGGGGAAGGPGGGAVWLMAGKRIDVSGTVISRGFGGRGNGSNGANSYCVATGGSGGSSATSGSGTGGTGSTGENNCQFLAPTIYSPAKRGGDGGSGGSGSGGGVLLAAPVVNVTGDIDAGTSTSGGSVKLYYGGGTAGGGTIIAGARFDTVQVSDCDGDGLSDYDEVTMYGTDPANWDSDGDGLPDGWEVNNGLNPTIADDVSADPDNDGLTTSQEFTYGTAPLDPDTDNDGFNDGEEITGCSDPNSATSDPTNEQRVPVLVTVRDPNLDDDVWQISLEGQPLVADNNPHKAASKLKFLEKGHTYTFNMTWLSDDGTGAGDEYDLQFASPCSSDIPWLADVANPSLSGTTGSQPTGFSKTWKYTLPGIDVKFAKPDSATWDDLEEKRVILHDEDTRIKIHIRPKYGSLSEITSLPGFDKLKIQTSATNPSGVDLPINGTTATLSQGADFSEVRITLTRSQLQTMGLLPSTDNDSVSEKAWYDWGDSGTSGGHNLSDGNAFEAGSSASSRGQCTKYGTLKDTPPNSPLDKSFLRAAGMERIRAKFGAYSSDERQLANQADIFYVSTEGHIATGLLDTQTSPNQTFGPSDAQWNHELNTVIVAGCSIFAIKDFRYGSLTRRDRLKYLLINGLSTPSPGEAWENTGPRYLLGYAFSAPLDSQGSAGIISTYLSLVSSGTYPIAAWGQANAGTKGVNACAIDISVFPRQYWYFKNVGGTLTWTSVNKGLTW